MMTESLPCSSEIITTLLIAYTPIQNKKFKKKELPNSLKSFFPLETLTVKFMPVLFVKSVLKSRVYSPSLSSQDVMSMEIPRSLSPRWVIVSSSRIFKDKS